MTKIIIYEAIRSLIYAPIYYLYLQGVIRGKHDIDIEIELFNENEGVSPIIGDKEVIKKILNHQDPNSIPIGICDPTAIFAYKDNHIGTTSQKSIQIALKKLVVLGNLIEKIAIWPTFLIHKSNKGTFIDSIEKKAFEESINLYDYLDVFDKSVFFLQSGFTTKKVFNKYFNRGRKRFEAKDISNNIEDETFKLIEGNLVLSNTPWISEGIIRNCKNEIQQKINEYEIIKPQLFCIPEFGSKKIAFTSIISKKVYWEANKDDERLECKVNREETVSGISSFFIALVETINQLYKNPSLFTYTFLAMIRETKFDIGFQNSQDINEIDKIVSDSLIKLISKGVFSNYTLTDIESFNNAMEMDLKLKKLSRTYARDIKEIIKPVVTKPSIGIRPETL